MSRVEDIAPEAVTIGMRVRFRVHRPGGDEPPYPVFVPAEGALMDGLQRGSARDRRCRRSPISAPSPRT